MGRAFLALYNYLWMYTSKMHQFSLPQIGYPLGGSSKNCTVVMFTSCSQLSWYYYCDIIFYYCDIRSPWQYHNNIYIKQYYPENVLQEVYMTTFCYCPPRGYSIRGAENSLNVSIRTLHKHYYYWLYILYHFL